MFAAVVLATLAIGVVAVTSDRGREGKNVNFGWNLLDGAKRSCFGSDGQPGVCMGQSECSEASGKSVGRCFPFDSCCAVTPNSCGSYSGFSTSYFQSPEKFQEFCTYKINVRQNVCQIRIDFEKFSLGQPTKPYNESAYFCERDEFTLLSSDNSKINLPVLCGENSGQHVYVPVNRKTSSDFKNKQQVTLRFQLTPRSDEFTDPEPSWRLKISQLECHPTSASWWKIKADIARQVWDLDEEEEKDVTKIKYNTAPEGCLQYFTEKDGVFESFNYNKGLGHYLGNLNYAVCFKRNLDTCGIKFKAVKFQVAYNQKLSSATDRDCDTDQVDSTQTTTAATTTTTTTTTTDATTTESSSDPTTRPEIRRDIGRQVITRPLDDFESEQSRNMYRRWPSSKRPDSTDVHSDYLLIPDGRFSENRFASKFCEKSLESLDKISVKTQGPLYVAFVSDEYSNPNEDVEKGFKIDYSLINTGC